MPKTATKISEPNFTKDAANDWTAEELKEAIKKGEESGVSKISNLAQYRVEFARKNR